MENLPSKYTASAESQITTGCGRWGSGIAYGAVGKIPVEIQGQERPMRVGVGYTTDMLTTALVALYRGQQSDPCTCDQDQALCCLDGGVNVFLSDEPVNWWELNRGDAALIAKGCNHSFFNTPEGTGTFLFSMAPVPALTG